MSEIIMVNVGDLVPHALHVTLYGKPEDGEEFADLVDDMKTEGQLKPIVIDEHDQVISGSRRLAAAKALGWDQMSAERVIFDSEEDRIFRLLAENEYRMKSKLMRVREYTKRMEMIEHAEDLRSRGVEVTDSRILAHLAVKDGKTVSRDEAGRAVALSPRSLHTGKKVDEAISKLREQGNNKFADQIEEKAHTSLSGALSMAERGEKAAPKNPPKPKTPQDALYWYEPTTLRLAQNMRGTAAKLRRRTNNTTPAALSFLLENIERMADRIDTWLRDNLQDCPICNGTMSIEGAPCKNCINGKTGQYILPKDLPAKVEEEDLKPMSAYCGSCGEEMIPSDQAAKPDREGTMICGPCQIKAKQAAIAAETPVPPSPPEQTLVKDQPARSLTLHCESCGDAMGKMVMENGETRDYLDEGAILDDEEGYLCGPCLRER